MPNKFHHVLVKIIVAEDQQAALAILAAETLHSDLSFNLWVAECAKGRLDESRMISLIEEYDDVTNRVLRATNAKGENNACCDIANSLSEALVWLKSAPIRYLYS